MKNRVIKIIVSLLFICGLHFIAFGQLQKLKIGPEKRFLVKEDGSPFVWIGATMWKWKSLSWTQIQHIIDVHSQNGYTVLQIIAYPDKYETVDKIVDYAASKNIYIGMVTGWWSEVLKGSSEKLYQRGFELGNRYKNNNNIVWLTAGESGGHFRKSKIPDENLEALVKGIRNGDTGKKLLTIHADYKRGTSIDNDAELVDFNNWQTSQWCCPDDLPRKDERKWTVWEAINFDYRQQPVKPTLDDEAWYENNKSNCGAEPFNIRRRAYFSIFAGGFGHTYGAGGIWDGLLKPKNCSDNFEDALHYTGFIQLGYLSEFLMKLESNLLKMRPNQKFILSDISESYDEHIQATVADDASFALVYSPSGNPFKLDLSMLNSERLKMLWFNPRENSFTKEEIVQQKNNLFDPPGKTEPGNDWILVIGKVLPL